jgi:hypothetical protein
MDPTLIPLFNQAQMDLQGDLHGLDQPGPAHSLWLGEVVDLGGELLAGSVLVGPLTGEAPTVMKDWDNLTLTGEGRALAIIWIDKRKVASGMLNMAGGPRNPNVLKIPEKIHSGYSFLALVIFTGEMFSCEAFFEPTGA